MIIKDKFVFFSGIFMVIINSLNYQDVPMMNMGAKLEYAALIGWGCMVMALGVKK